MTPWLLTMLALPVVWYWWFTERAKSNNLLGWSKKLSGRAYILFYNHHWLLVCGQARNYIREMKAGDKAFFYHSNCKQPGIVGIMEVSWYNTVLCHPLHINKFNNLCYKSFKTRNNIQTGLRMFIKFNPYFFNPHFWQTFLNQISWLKSGIKFLNYLKQARTMLLVVFCTRNWSLLLVNFCYSTFYDILVLYKYTQGTHFKHVTGEH